MFKSLLILSLLVTWAHAHVEGLYGDDDRHEVGEFEELNELARSVAVMVENTKLSRIGNAYDYDKLTLKDKHNICETERFINQPALGLCTGSLVAPDIVLTAAHCVEVETDCSESSWVFDYKLDRKGENPKSFSSSDVFNCKKVIHSSFYPSLEVDFALVQLDRKVEGRFPLKLAQPGRLPFGREIFMLGFPSGLPMKVATNAQVFLSTPYNFKTNLDAFGGNSGSPVFDQESREILGILISGKGDYEEKGSCRVPQIYPQMSMQETATGVKLILEALRE